jgi:hypothetical protein
VINKAFSFLTVELFIIYRRPKMSKKGVIALIVLAIAFFIGQRIFFAYQIEQVKNSTDKFLNTDNTFGYVFERHFTDTKWECIISQGYNIYVNFSGKDPSNRNVFLQLSRSELVADSWVVMYAEIDGRALSLMDTNYYIQNLMS